jgi:hypothetical protein
MPRLIVNPDTAESWPIELQPGTLSLGRAEGNDVPIEHSSVSSTHCQMTVSDQGTWLKDLGSTAGTFVNGELVEEVKLRSGQRIRLGEVELQYESEVPEPPAAQDVPLPPRLDHNTPTNRYCKSHPTTLGRYVCRQCQHTLCEVCVSTRMENGAPRRSCRRCGSECQPVRMEHEQPVEAPGFLKSLPGALVYPFQGSGVIMLIAGTAFFFLLGSVPLLGLIVTGYMFSFAKSIVTSTAGGKKELPDWPDFSDWKDDILMPYLQLLALLVLSFGPAFLILALGSEKELATMVAFFVALGFGVLLAPMGVLALAMFDQIRALNPIALTWSILRVPLPYLAAATAFGLVFVIHFLVQNLIESMLSIPFLPGLLSSMIYLYLVSVGMRILGLLYRTHKEELGWFSR